jgi:non-heme chloroperoxidase
MIARMPMLDLPGGASLAYDDEGAGRPLVLIHGVSMSRRFFERNVGPLSQRFRVVNVDLRGHGDSPPSEGGHGVAQ